MKYTPTHVLNSISVMSHLVFTKFTPRRPRQTLLMLLLNCGDLTIYLEFYSRLQSTVQLFSLYCDNIFLEFVSLIIKLINVAV